MLKKRVNGTPLPQIPPDDIYTLQYNMPVVSDIYSFEYVELISVLSISP